jgi:hypothetical protein
MRRVAVYKMIPDDSLSLSKGAIAVNGFKSLTAEDGWNGPLIAAVGEKYGFSMDTPVSEFTEKQMNALLYGTGEERYHVTRFFGGEAHEQITTYEGIVDTATANAAVEKLPSLHVNLQTAVDKVNSIGEADEETQRLFMTRVMPMLFIAGARTTAAFERIKENNYYDSEDLRAFMERVLPQN